MARHISALKRARQNEKRRLRNQSRKTRVKTCRARGARRGGPEERGGRGDRPAKGRAHHRQGGRQGHPPLAHRRPEDLPPHPAGPGPAKRLNKAQRRDTKGTENYFSVPLCVLRVSVVNLFIPVPSSAGPTPATAAASRRWSSTAHRSGAAGTGGRAGRPRRSAGPAAPISSCPRGTNRELFL